MKLSTCVAAAALLTSALFIGVANADDSTATIAPPPPASAPSPLPAPAPMMGPSANSHEIGIAGNAQFNSGHPYSVSAIYGTFVNPSMELGAEGTFSGSDGNSSFASVGAVANFFSRSQASNQTFSNETMLVLPYVGGFLGVSDHSQMDASIGAQAGAKMFVGPSAAVTAELQYRSTKEGNGNTEVVLGISVIR